MLGQDSRWAEDPRERDEDPRERDARERDRWNPRDVFLHELELLAATSASGFDP